MTKLKAAVIGALAIAGVATPLVLQHRALDTARTENKLLKQDTGTLAGLREENARLAKLKASADELDRLRKEHAELLRLRGDAAALRRLNDDLTRQRETNASKLVKKLGASPYLTAAQIDNVGLATPEAAVQTFAWAIQTGDTNLLKEVMDTDRFYAAMHEMRHKLDPDFKPEEEKSHNDDFNFNSFQKTSTLTGLQILSQQFSSAEDAVLEVAYSDTQSTETNHMTFHRVGDDWKMDMLALANPDSFQYTNVVTQPDGTEKAEVVKLKVEERKELKLVPAVSATNPP